MTQLIFEPSEQQDQRIREIVNSGRYRDASDVLSAGLRLIEQQERENDLKLQALRRLADQALADIDRGNYTLIDSDEALSRFMVEVSDRSRSAIK